jgi:AcrR family transcriptional regulator
MSATSHRHRMTGAQRREQILDVTQALVAEHGFHGISIEAVCRAAGITRPVVYGHFGDLAGLLSALIDRVAERASAQLETVLPSGTSGEAPGEQLLASLRSYLEAVRADPLTWRLVLMPPEGAPEALRDHIAEGRAEVVSVLAAAVAGGLTPGPGRSPDPELTARTFSALSDEAARLVLTDPASFPPERVEAHARWLLERLGR